MVAKVFKKTPTKSIRAHKNHLRRGRKKSPIKNPSAAAAAATVSSVVVASINKSFYTCRGRLVKIFSKLACISGTPKKTPRKRGYHILEKVSDAPGPDLRRSLFKDEKEKSLPPIPSPDKKTIFLDLDETLVHSQPNPPPENYDFVVRPVIDGEIVEFFVLKRPFVDEFLETLSKKFEIVVFTAGIKEYASLVLDRLDKKGLISHRLYRDSCKEVDGRFVKDLSELGRDMKSVVIVDDNPNSYIFQPRNAIPIRAFTNDMEDGELKRLMEFFDGCDGVEDMRDAVKGFVAEEEFKDVEV
nr:probable C-terminal domain small phosphatase [Ipomoea batatas]